MLVIANWRDLKHPDAGGAEVVCERLARSFAQRGHEVVLLTSAVKGERRKERIDGYLTIRHGSRFTVYPWALLWLMLHRSQISAVIDSQNGIPFFTPLAVRPTTPVLMLLHHIHQDQFAIYFSPMMARVGRWLERGGARLVYRDRTIVAVSPSTREAARRDLGLKGDIVVVPPGLDSVIIPLAGGKDRSDHPRIVCVGRLVAHKRTALIVEAIPDLLAEFPRLELHVVGNGPERPELERRTESLGLRSNVIFHGAVDSVERDQLMRTAWMSVNASDGEGWGLSVLEANALGVPVLAYRRPGLRYSIRDRKTGWLIEEDHELGRAISDALRSVSDEAAAEACNVRARHWASQFTWERMADQVQALLLAEERRLGQLPSNRRTGTDLTTVVRVPSDLLPDGKAPEFRHTDACQMSGTDLVVLLRNADTDTAKAALHRSALTASGMIDERVRISVARPIDLVSPMDSALPTAALAAQLAVMPEERRQNTRAG